MTLSYVVIYILWVFPLILQAAILFGMVRRKLVRSFPIFFSYTFVVFFSETGLLFFKPSGSVYYRLYTCKEALAILLGFAVVVEILRHILPPYLSPRFVVNFLWILVALLAVTALFMFVSSKPLTGNYAMKELLVLAERSLRFLQASFLIVMIALMSVLGLTWQHNSLGILLGFGVYSAVALAAYEFCTLHRINPIVFSMLNSAGYNVAVLIWAFYILRTRQRPPVGRLPDADLADWNNALSSYVNHPSSRR